MCLTITVCHCLILVMLEIIWPRTMVLPAALDWVPNHFREAGWRVLMPVEHFLHPNGVAMTCAGHCQLR
jgi:hypothetical protein